MFRKFKGLMALFAIICVTAIAGGSAYFYFGGYEEDRVIDNNAETPDDIKADNILENYEFGNKKDLNETYTYYFFPSTLYMSDDFFSSNLNPESIFGYNEVILDDNGDPALDSKGQPQYNIVDGNGITTKDTAQKYSTYYDYLADYLNNKSDSYLHPTATSIGNSYGISKTNGTHYFGNGLDGDDYSYNGYSLSLRDPYMLNNTDAYDFFLNNYNVDNFYSDASTSNEGWGKLHQYNVLDTVTTINKINEVLSPITNQSSNYSPLFDININTDNGLTIESNNNKNGSYTRSDLINVFSNLYQKGVSGETLSKNSLSQVEIRYNSGELDFTSDFNTFSLISYGSGIGAGKVIGENAFIQYNNEYPYVGTWVNSNDNMRHILTLYNDGILDEEGKTVSGTGYFAFYRGGEYNVNTFNYVYNIETNEINIEGDYIKGSFVFKDGNQVSQMGNRAQYRNDRFGYWTSFYDWSDPNNKNYYIDNSASRYLPIKITVNGNLTPDDMAKVIPSLSTSMFDDHMWFDFSANVWTYVSYANNAYNFNSKEYTTATGGFTAKDITNIFDIMQNPSKYADKDGNIRLFPVFSNGKNTGGSITEGGSDAIQASFTYNDNFTPSIANDLSPSSTKMTYSSYTFDSYYLFYDVNYAVLKNIMITNNKFNELKIRIDTTDSAANWTGKWTDIYTFSGTQLNNLISTYGEGLYTFYLFVGGRATDWNRGNRPFSGEDLISKVTKDSNSGNELYKKYLLPLSDDSNLESIVVEGASSNKYVVNDLDGIVDKARPVALAVEKVTNLRLVSDIPIAEDENGLPSANQDWDSIDGNIQQGLLNAKNFTIADEVYAFDDDIYEMENINLNSGVRLDTNNPYIYVIQNADFRFVNNLYFQIRFSNDYINNAMNVTTDYSSIKTNKPKKYVAYSVNGQILKFKFQDSDKPDNDVFIQNASAGSGNNVRQGFKLKDYNARGIYDILLVSHGTSGNIQQYYMYVNRHTNSFIKLFYGNPGTFEFDQTGSGDTTSVNNFVSHKLPSEDDTPGDSRTRNSSSTLLWNGQTYLGEYLTSKTTGIRYTRNGTDEEKPITDKDSDNTLFAAIQDWCGITPGTDTIYAIKDAVTGRVVAYYNSGVGRLFTSSGSVGSSSETSASLDLFTILKNYVLYIEPAYIGTWRGIIGLNKIELVINDDGTILYNDELYTYTDDGNTIIAVDEHDSYQLTIVYDKATKSLHVTLEDPNGGSIYDGVLNDFVPANSGEETP